MTTTLKINGSERDVVRVFHLDLPREDAPAFATRPPDGDWAFARALGAEALRDGFVDLVDLRALGAMSLARYLEDAHGVRADELAPVARQLGELEGHVVVMPSQAFDQTSQTLTVTPPLRWIGTFGEVRADAPGAPLHSEAAHGRAAPAPDRAPQRGGSAALKLIVAVIVMVVLGALLVTIA